jgi:hypothetical protein
MLGDLIYEHKGKVTGQRVLDSVSRQEEVPLPKIETTFSADAKLKGTIDITDTETYWSVVRPGGYFMVRVRGCILPKIVVVVQKQQHGQAAV